MLLLPIQPASAQPAPRPVVRLTELDIERSALERFERAANEHADATLGTEPGALAFHVVAEKHQPNRIRMFEMYADERAWREHLQSAHFQRFRSATDGMAVDRRLHDTIPVRLGAKPRLPTGRPLVRIAEIDVDPARLDAYKVAVSEEIDTSIRIEPGVLAIYSVALQDGPTRLRFFEIYADDNAYRQHIASPHFRKYVDITKDMIASRRLYETQPIVLRIQGIRP